MVIAPAAARRNRSFGNPRRGVGAGIQTKWTSLLLLRLRLRLSLGMGLRLRLHHEASGDAIYLIPALDLSDFGDLGRCSCLGIHIRSTRYSKLCWHPLHWYP